MAPDVIVGDAYFYCWVVDSPAILDRAAERVKLKLRRIIVHLIIVFSNTWGENLAAEAIQISKVSFKQHLSM